MDHIKILFAVLLVAITFTSITAQKCWQCTAEVRDTTDLTKQPPCVRGNFPAEGVHQMPCEEGECITYTALSTGEPPYLTRGCLTLRKQLKKMCDGYPGIADVSCCKGDLCNNADGVTNVKFVTIVLITTCALAAMLHIMD